MEKDHKCSENMCLCAGRPECHICSWHPYGTETIEEAVKVAENYESI